MITTNLNAILNNDSTFKKKSVCCVNVNGLTCQWLKERCLQSIRNFYFLRKDCFVDGY